LLKDEGRADTAQALCQEVSARAPAATWAWRRLGFFALDASNFERAVLCFQTALRGDVRHVGSWEGLGSAYQSLARLTAALKVLPSSFPCDLLFEHTWGWLVDQFATDSLERLVAGNGLFSFVFERASPS
jgi:tetratricopeptide (TPR) repeat protein